MRRAVRSSISGAKPAAMSATTTPTVCSWPWEFPSRSRASWPAMVSPSSPMPTPRRPTACNPTGTTLVGRPQSGLSSRVRAIAGVVARAVRVEAGTAAAVGQDALCRGRNAGRVRLVSHGARRPAVEPQRTAARLDSPPWRHASPGQRQRTRRRVDRNTGIA